MKMSSERGRSSYFGVASRYMFATSVFRACYRWIAKPLFFAQDPEIVHDRMCHMGEFLGEHALMRGLTGACFAFSHPVLVQDLQGIHFANPIGLAAGFDKNARLTQILPVVGFGFEEVGSITGEPCEGNPKPRLWRLPKSRGLVVYYGLKNDGCEVISRRLSKQRFVFPIGVSIAKTNSQATCDTDTGIADYTKAFRAFLEIADYFTVNISCPNAFGGQPFTTPDRLDLLLAEIDKIPTSKPIFIKLPPDLSFDELDALLAVSDKHRIHGFILGNLTKKYDRPEIMQDEMAKITHGGISGKPTFQASNELIAHLYRTTRGRYTIIGCGGVFSAEDAYEKIRQGASLVQLITGMIFEGPQLIGEINRGLVRLLQRDGYTNIAQAIGAAHRN